MEAVLIEDGCAAHSLGQRRQHEQSEISSVLRGRRSAGRRVVEEKLFMKRQEKRLNVSTREKRRLEDHCSGLWSGTEVRGLTNVASRFVPGVQVGVR